MPLEQRLDAARAFWLDEDATDDQVEALLLISEQKKFRPKTLMSLDADRKARHLATVPHVTDALAVRVLVLYHLTARRALMGTFLDALGIAHENGLIQDEHVKPDPEKIRPAVAELARQFPAADVTLYLNTLLSQDPETWGALADVIAEAEAAAGENGP